MGPSVPPPAAMVSPLIETLLGDARKATRKAISVASTRRLMLTDALSLGSAAGSIVRPGARRTGVDRYDINSLGTEFVSQVLRERGNRRITNRGDVIAGAPRRAAADVDDAPPPTILEEMRRDSPRGTQVTGDFDVHVEKQICAGNLYDLRR